MGLMPQMSYEEKESVLVPGEGVLFYTDGLVEAHNPRGEMFGALAFGISLVSSPRVGRASAPT